MKIKILQVFYDKTGLPYKDKERQVHYPITSGTFLGASNTTQIRFYYDQLDELNESTFVAVSKLPNGKIGSEILESEYDSELQENYAILNLSSFYTQYKGDVYISLQGYQGGVKVEQDENGIYQIYGTPTIQATGSIKLSIAYAPTFIGSGQTENITLQRVLAELSTKLGIRQETLHVEELPTVGNPNVFYVVNDEPNNPNLANIYVWNENTRHYIWVGDNTLDLGEYYTKNQGEDFEESIDNRVTHVENELSSVASGSPRGAYGTLSDLQTADPNHGYIYLVLENGEWYYWNGSAWASGGPYLAPQSELNKLYMSQNQNNEHRFVYGKVGKNLFDKTLNIVEGKYLNPNTGQISSVSGYFYQDYYIEIEGGEQYSISSFSNISSGVFVVFYDSSKTFISGIQVSNSYSFVTPSTAKYCRLSAPLSIIDNYQLEKGNISAYEPFEQINKDESITYEMLKKPIGDFNSEFIKELGKKYGSTPSASIIEHNAGYLLKNNGDIEGGYSATEWFVSDYIDASKGAYVETVAYSIYAGVCEYDENYNFIKAFTNLIDTSSVRDIVANIPEGECKYIRVQYRKIYIPNNFVVKIFNSAKSNVDKFLETNSNIVIVDKNGNGDFTEIQDALDNVNDSQNNPITIIVKEGTYNHFHTWRTKSTIYSIRYVNIIGVDRDKCIVNDTLNSTFVANGTLANMTLISNSTLPTGYTEDEYDSLFGYALHIDYCDCNKNVINCKMISYKGAVIGIGTHENETLTLKDCEFLRIESENAVDHPGAYVAIYAHNGFTNAINQVLSIKNCLFKSDFDYGMYLHCAPQQGLLTVECINNVIWSKNNGMSAVQTTAGSKLSGEYIELSGISFGNSNTKLNNAIGN